MSVIINFGKKEHVDYFLSKEADHLYLLAYPYHGTRIGDTVMKFSEDFLFLINNPNNKEILFGRNHGMKSLKK